MSSTGVMPHHRGAQHLPRAAVARACGSRPMWSMPSPWSRTPRCARSTCTARGAVPRPTAPCRRCAQRRLARLPRARGLALLRELVLAPGHRARRRHGRPRRARTLHRARWCSTSCGAPRRCALGIDLPADKRLRALCEAMLDDPTRAPPSTPGPATSAPARARWRGCSAASWAPRFGQWRQQVLLAHALTHGGTQAADGQHRRRAGLCQRQRLHGHGAAHGGSAAEPLLRHRALKRAPQVANIVVPTERTAMTAVLYDYTRQDARGASSTAQAWARVPPPLGAAGRAQARRPRRGAAEGATTPCWWRTTTSTATCRTWRWRPAAASPIRWRWRASAATTRRRRWSWPGCASWARAPRSCRPTSAC